MRTPRARRKVTAMEVAAPAAVLVAGLWLVRWVKALPHAVSVATGGRVNPDETSGRGAPDTPASGEARRAGHETEDMSGRTMALLVAGLGGAVACVIGVIWVTVAVLTHLDHRAEPRFTAQQVAPMPPPLPNLQAAPLSEIAALNAREEMRLTTYGWTDAGHTRARIPLARAMTLIEGKTLDTAP